MPLDGAQYREVLNQFAKTYVEYVKLPSHQIIPNNDNTISSLIWYAPIQALTPPKKKDKRNFPTWLKNEHMRIASEPCSIGEFSMESSKSTCGVQYVNRYRSERLVWRIIQFWLPSACVCMYVHFMSSNYTHSLLLCKNTLVCTCWASSQIIKKSSDVIHKMYAFFIYAGCNPVTITQTKKLYCNNNANSLRSAMAKICRWAAMWKLSLPAIAA